MTRRLGRTPTRPLPSESSYSSQPPRPGWPGLSERVSTASTRASIATRPSFTARRSSCAWRSGWRKGAGCSKTRLSVATAAPVPPVTAPEPAPSHRPMPSAGWRGIPTTRCSCTTAWTMACRARPASRSTRPSGIEIPLTSRVKLLNDPAATSVVFLRGTPTAINTPALQPVFMYDGRDASLEEQALGAIQAHAQNGIEPTALQLQLIADFQRLLPASSRRASCSSSQAVVRRRRCLVA